MNSFNVLLLVILGISNIHSKSVRNQLKDIKVTTTTTTVKPVVTVEDKLKCDEEVCSHIRQPVCSLVNDKPMTAPTRCELDNKIRCSKVLRKVLGSKVPVIYYLHDGECLGNENGDKWKSRSVQKKKTSKKLQNNRKNFNKTAEKKRTTRRGARRQYFS